MTSVASTSALADTAPPRPAPPARVSDAVAADAGDAAPQQRPPVIAAAATSAQIDPALKVTLVCSTSIFVPDVEATIAELTATGFETVDTDLRLSSWSETFVRPKSGFGCLFQIVSCDLDWLTPHPTATVEQVLAGEWRWWQTNIWHIDDLPPDYPTDFPLTDRPTPAR